MIEQLHLYGERQMHYGEKRAKDATKKVCAQNNFKILPKNRAPVPGYSSSEYPGNEVELPELQFDSQVLSQDLLH